jgi:pimeloyl-ACP methyl ester carboxylesterase
VRLVLHAASVLPGSGSHWAAAMRHELDYIAADPAALRWALGCIVACYRARLGGFGAPASLRNVSAGGVLMLAVGVALAGHASGQTEPPRPVFEDTACDLPDISPAVQPRLRCGWVVVPRNYDNPGAGSFKLAVVVVKSAELPALPDPVVYISGGPGAPLTLYADHQARNPYAPRRDLVLVDQRGTGRSEPRLCPDLDKALFDADITVAAELTEDALAKRRAVYQSCRDEAVARGIDLNDFGTTITVADFERVRRALGIERWNVYGESYGTTVAMTLLALHPETVRSVVLDSIYPPDPQPQEPAPTPSDALGAFFAYCSGDQLCAKSFPDLAGTYREALARLERTPLIVAAPPEMHRPDGRLRLTAPLFKALVENLIYYPVFYERLPHLIVSVHDGDGQDLPAVLASAYAMLGSLSHAAHVAVECRDRPHYRDPLPAGASVAERAQLNDICSFWSALGPAPLIPVGTAVPTLVLEGEFDPVARPSFSQHIAALIGGNAHWVEFPRVGHNVRGFSPCGAKIAAAFIDDPAQMPDTSCVDRRPRIAFVPRDMAP